MNKEEAIQLCESMTLLTGVYFNLIETKSGKYLREPYMSRCHLRGTQCQAQAVSEGNLSTCPGGYYFLTESVKQYSRTSAASVAAGPFLKADYGQVDTNGTHQETRRPYAVPILNARQVKALEVVLKRMSECFSNVRLVPEYSIENSIRSHGNDSSSQLIRRLKIYVYEHLSEELTLREAARKLSLSESYLCRILKKELGFTFKEYVNIIRIEQSKIYLKQHKYKISEVGTLCGFPDHNYFSRIFKKLEGISPSEYARM